MHYGFSALLKWMLQDLMAYLPIELRVQSLLIPMEPFLFITIAASLSLSLSLISLSLPLSFSLPQLKFKNCLNITFIQAALKPTTKHCCNLCSAASLRSVVTFFSSITTETCDAIFSASNHLKQCRHGRSSFRLFQWRDIRALLTVNQGLSSKNALLGHGSNSWYQTR